MPRASIPFRFDYPRAPSRDGDADAPQAVVVAGRRKFVASLRPSDNRIASDRPAPSFAVAGAKIPQPASGSVLASCKLATKKWAGNGRECSSPVPVPRGSRKTLSPSNLPPGPYVPVASTGRTVNLLLPAVAASFPHVMCEGASDGRISLLVIGGHVTDRSFFFFSAACFVSCVRRRQPPGEAPAINYMSTDGGINNFDQG